MPELSQSTHSYFWVSLSITAFNGIGRFSVPYKDRCKYLHFWENKGLLMEAHKGKVNALHNVAGHFSFHARLVVSYEWQRQTSLMA